IIRLLGFQLDRRWRRVFLRRRIRYLAPCGTRRQETQNSKAGEGNGAHVSQHATVVESVCVHGSLYPVTAEELLDKTELAARTAGCRSSVARCQSTESACPSQQSPALRFSMSPDRCCIAHSKADSKS